MDLLFPTLLGAIFGRCRCRSFATAGHRGGPAGRVCSRRRWFPEFSQRDPILPGHIVAHTLESERPFVGHGLPPVLLGEPALPGLHLGVGHAFRNPPEPHTVWVELHPLGLAEIPGARLDRLAVLAVAGRAIDVDVFDPFENLFALGDDLFISPPPGRHVLVGVLRRSRRRGLNRSFLLTAPRNDKSKTSNDRQDCQACDLHSRPQAPFLSANLSHKKDAFLQGVTPPKSSARVHVPLVLNVSFRVVSEPPWPAAAGPRRPRHRSPPRPVLRPPRTTSMRTPPLSRPSPRLRKSAPVPVQGRNSLSLLVRS